MLGRGREEKRECRCKYEERLCVICEIQCEVSESCGLHRVTASYWGCLSPFGPLCQATLDAACVLFACVQE